MPQKTAVFFKRETFVFDLTLANELDTTRCVLMRYAFIPNMSFVTKLVKLLIKALNTFQVTSHISTDIFYKGQLKVMLCKIYYIHFQTFNKLQKDKYTERIKKCIVFILFFPANKFVEIECSLLIL